ncbi:MAG TPA: extracellular solute-binding protein, partial [Clostridiaceae bacterium]|nr:extracellular solute-binding protein [Clostridiaceae bacterium]
NMIIAYNSDKVSDADAPKTWEDLLDPKWNGKIAIPNPLLSGSAFASVAAISDKYGWEYFAKLRENGAIVEKGNSAVQAKLLTGEYEVAMILEENILKVADAGEPVKIVYPADGTIVIPSPIAVFKDSKNMEASKKVMEWFLSKEGQQLIVKGWMHSVREDVESPKGADKLSSFIGTKMDTNWEKFSKEAESIKTTFSKTSLE